MSTHWFLHDKHVEFRNSIGAIIDTATVDLRRSDARATLGDEHDQCQYLFTKMYTLMRDRQEELSRVVLCCSSIPDPVVELRYYRSRVKRSKTQTGPQFIEGETGADFALVLDVSFPDILRAQRSVMGQAKILEGPSVRLDDDQLDQIIRVAGSESAAYLIWGQNQAPIVVSAENIAALRRTQGVSRLSNSVLRFGRPLSEFFSEAFIGLWFGKDYTPEKAGEAPPKDSVAILYHFLHMGVPPPNLVYFGMTSGRLLGIRPGVYVNEVVDL
jgi:hypothetical protein